MLTLANFIELIATTFIPLLNPSIDAPVSTADAANDVRAQVLHTIQSGLDRVSEQRRSWELRTQVSTLRRDRALLEQQLESLCVWEHQELDGEVVTAVLPLQCNETVRSRSTKVVSTAYYSPVEGQSRYATGTLEGDRELNGRGVRTADGTVPYRGTVAAPPEYAFGTMLYVEGFGAGEVHDRGGAIQRHGSHDRIDLWMGVGDAGLRASERWGVQEHEAAVFVAGDSEDIETILDRFVG